MIIKTEAIYFKELNFLGQESWEGTQAAWTNKTNSGKTPKEKFVHNSRFFLQQLNSDWISEY